MLKTQVRKSDRKQYLPRKFHAYEEWVEENPNIMNDCASSSPIQEYLVSSKVPIQEAQEQADGVCWQVLKAPLPEQCSAILPITAQIGCATKTLYSFKSGKRNKPALS
ncbi:MAG: hypothetical protein ACXWF8_12350 [Methylobacter sp.]